MGIELPIVVYTHTDMKDTWEMFFGQLKKYLPNNKVYVAVNETDTNLSDYIQIIYNDSNLYTDRWKEILPQIAEETILFLHEDMVLFDEVKLDFNQWLETRKFAPVIKALKKKLKSMKEEELDFQSKKLTGFNSEHADIISERIIQKITKQFANHLKESENDADDSLELIQKVFQLELNS